MSENKFEKFKNDKKLFFEEYSSKLLNVVSPYEASDKRLHFHQEEILNSDESIINIIIKERQIGLSTLFLLNSIYNMIFYENFSVGFVSPNFNTKSLIQNHFSKMMDIVVSDSTNEINYSINNKYYKKLNNNSSIHFSCASEDLHIGWSFDLIFVDEAAYMKDLQEVLNYIVPCLNKNGKIYICSTTNTQKTYFDELVEKTIYPKVLIFKNDMHFVYMKFNGKVESFKSYIMDR